MKQPSLALKLIFPSLLGWVVGTAGQLQQVDLASAQTYQLLLLCAVGFGFTASTNKLAFPARALCTLVCTGLLAFGATGLRAGSFIKDALNPQLEGRDLVVTGVVAAMPQRNESGLRFRLDVESASLEAAPVLLPPRIYLSWYNGPIAAVTGPGGGPNDGVELQRSSADLVAGERWQMTVRLKAPHGGSNPHGFDFELWLWEQGLQATGYVRAGAKETAPQRLARTWAHPLERARQAVRDRIFETIQDRKIAGVIAALVVGDQNAIDRADWDIFRATGVAHLMSISGLHVTMFAWLMMALTRWLWRRSLRLCFVLPATTAGLIGGLLLALAYALFSGWGVPSQRTVLMLAVVSVLRMGSRRWPWPSVWMLTCAVVVLADPWALLQAGFWLSFVAVGVLFATDAGQGRSPPRRHAMGTNTSDGIDSAQDQLSTAIDDPLEPEKKPRHATRMFDAAKASMREQVVITVALTPLTLLLFGQVSVSGLFANLLAIPWVTLVVTPLALIGVVFSSAWSLAAGAIQMLSAFLQVLASLPFASIAIAQAPIWAGVLGVVGGVLVAMRLPWPMRLLGLPMLLPVVLWQASQPALGTFDVLAADIGQGNAVLVRTARHALLYDAGPRFSRESDAGHRVLVPLLRTLDVKLDKVVLSHRDADHTGGAIAVLSMHKGAELLSSIELGHEIQAVRKAQRCEAGQRWHWDGVDFTILHPDAQDYERPAKSNALSCVLKISNGRQTALLTGDIELEQEASLVGQAAVGHIDLKSTLLLVPHHGSATSSTGVFLDAVNPKFGLVQNGYRNRFGHPAQPVRERYEARGIQLVDSPRCGAATWRSDAPDNVACDRQMRRRYWHHRLP